MHKSLGLGLSVAAIITTGLTPTAGWAAVTNAAAPVHAVSSTPAGGDPDTTVTFTVSNGALAMTAPASVNLGAGPPGTTITGVLGVVTVTDNRALLAATWTATASSTDFTTGGGTPSETIPSEDVTYTPGPITTTGTITVTGHQITLTEASQTTIAATAGVGDNTATWDPTLAVAVPAAAVSGLYTGTLTQSAA
jgi:hypothetical protein